MTKNSCERDKDAQVVAMSVSPADKLHYAYHIERLLVIYKRKRRCPKPFEGGTKVLQTKNCICTYIFQKQFTKFVHMGCIFAVTRFLYNYIEF